MERLYKVQVEINGREFEPLEFSCLQEIHSHSQFHLVFLTNQFENDYDEFSLEDVKDNLNKETKIKISYSDEGKENQSFLFNGIITELVLEREFGSSHEVEISGYGNSIKLEDGKHSRSFLERPIGNLIHEVLEPYDLKTSISIKHDVNLPYVSQYKESNFQFLSRIADLRGEWFYYDGETLYFGEYTNRNEITIQLGESIGQYDIRMRLTPAKFSYQAYFYNNNQSYSSNSGSISVSGLNYYGEAALKASEELFSSETLVPILEEAKTKKEVEDYLKYKKSTIATGMIVLSGDSNNPGIQIGAKLKLKEKKDKEVGTFLVTHVSHTASAQGNYRNYFEAVPASIQFPPVNNLVNRPIAETQVAVIRDIEDPDKLGRVKVQFYWQKEGETTNWIRVLKSHAGAGDLYFSPEVDDEVLVGFEFDNPDRPIVLGSLYHGAAPPAYYTPENSIKAIKTKDGNRIILVDGDEGKISILNKEDKNEISLSLEENGKITIRTEGELCMEAKTIQMKAEEMTVETDNNLSFKSGQDASLEAQNLSLDAQQALEQSGLEVKVSAQTSAEFSASASLKVEGGAMTEIKGGIVKIN